MKQLIKFKKIQEHVYESLLFKNICMKQLIKFKNIFNHLTKSLILDSYLNTILEIRLQDKKETD